MTKTLELANFNEKGFIFFRNLFDLEFVANLKEALDRSYEVCRKVQLENGVDQITDGTVHHLLATGEPIYLTLLEKICSSPLHKFMKSFFNGNYIVNGYGGVINLPNKLSYVGNIHRDIRFFSNDFPLMINLLVMIDNFSLENGATYLLAGSHKFGFKPSDDEFYKLAARATGNPGDLLLFNSNLWHAAGLNNTNIKRRAFTITFSKPFLKQQLDYCRALGYEVIDGMDVDMKQVLGYFSRTPSNLYEWYQKEDNRFYRPGQDL